MKKFLLFVFLGIFMSQLFAADLVLINVKSEAEKKALFTQKELIIHYATDKFVIATAPANYTGDITLLDHNCWSSEKQYSIVWFHKGEKGNYKNSIQGLANILSESDHYLVLKSSLNISIPPPADGNIVKINNSKLTIPTTKFNYSKSLLDLDPDIVEMIGNVDTVLYLQNLQHLQDYGTRNAYSPQGVEAQNWIKQQYEDMGYEVSLFDFTMPNGPASDDVIAKKTGTKYPNEYVILGGHYDSYSYSGNAPGADDDGTGSCGVLEAARVMAGYDFDRTILFCAWSGEEYGLYGSEAYASWAENQGMNILGYFNIDMCGYRNPGDPIHTDMIAPSSAQPLIDFYNTVCALYLPDFLVEPGSLSGGDSDHTSFNNHGYMGIFPFEDSQHYSPYIHTSGDVIGTSVNSLEMCMLFTQAMVANVATMANLLAPPQNLVGISGDNHVQLSWDPMLDIDHYNVYKDNNLVASPVDPNYPG